MRNGPGEVRRSIDGIHDPQILSQDRRTGFLTQEAVLGKGCGDLRFDVVLHRGVGFRQKVLGPLIDDLALGAADKADACQSTRTCSQPAQEFHALVEVNGGS